MTSPGNCRSCGQAVLWVTTANGKKTPLNIPPARGLWTVEGGVARPIAGAYSSHFSTCPNADQHRRPRKETKQ